MKITKIDPAKVRVVTDSMVLYNERGPVHKKRYYYGKYRRYTNFSKEDRSRYEALADAYKTINDKARFIISDIAPFVAGDEIRYSQENGLGFWVSPESVLLDRDFIHLHERYIFNK